MKSILYDILGHFIEDIYIPSGQPNWTWYHYGLLVLHRSVIQFSVSIHHMCVSHAFLVVCLMRTLPHYIIHTCITLLISALSSVNLCHQSANKTHKGFTPDGEYHGHGARCVKGSRTSAFHCFNMTCHGNMPSTIIIFMFFYSGHSGLLDCLANVNGSFSSLHWASII
jgi:hypothetical protein